MSDLALDTQRLDHLISDSHGVYAGKHLLIDLYGASRIDDLEWIKKAMKEAVIASKATLLHIHLHHFTPNDGVSGVAVLAESHISLHTWPELQFASFDVFMCGDAEPEMALDVFKEYFEPKSIGVKSYRRGDKISEYTDV